MRSTFKTNRPLSFPTLLLLSLAGGLLAAACGGSSGGGGSQNGVPGQEVTKPGAGGATFFVDQNQGGRATNLLIADMFWGRLVDVHDVDLTGSTNTVPVFRDFAVNENVQTSLLDYLLETNPVTQKTRLVIRRNRATQRAEFNQLLLAATQSMPPITPKNDDGTDAGPFSFIARNAALVIRFNDALRDDTVSEADLIETVKVVTGYTPSTPFLTRLLFDPNHGAIASNKFHSTRVLVDMTVSETEAAEMIAPQPINSLGLPSSLSTTGQPNTTIRIPSRVDFGAGQFTVLTNLSGSTMGTAGNGPVDLSSPTMDVVRAMRSGNPVDSNNGFLLDQNSPEVVGGWPLTVLGAVNDPTGTLGFDFVLNVQFPTVCRGAPELGDTIQNLSRFLEVTEDAAPPDQSGQISTVRVRLLSDTGLANPNALLGSSLFLSTFDPMSLVPTGCWVNFVPQPQAFPSFQVSTSAQILTRFSEPMDPAALDPFDNYQVVRGNIGISTTPDTLVIGSVRSSNDLRRYTYTPALPFTHQLGAEEDFHVDLVLPTDLAGNQLVSQLPPVEFTIDPFSPTEVNGGITLRFSSPDEVLGDSAGLSDLRGQFNYDLSRGIIQPRPVTFSGLPADRSAPVPSVMFPFPLGSQTPLSPLGSKLHAVWRYADVGWPVRDETKYNVDVVGLNWSPIGGQVVSDFYEGFEIRLAHSKQLPDEDLTPAGAPRYPNSGLFGSPMFYLDNILDDPASPQKTVHPRALGYEVNPADLFVALTGTFMIPFPLNREGAATQTYTWRDTAILAKGGDQGVGIPMNIEVTVGVEPPSSMQMPNQGAGSVAGPGNVPSFGLPLLMEYRCYPSNSGVGLNLFDVSLAVAVSARPAFRSYSTGGVDTTGSPISKNPDLELVPTGAFNPFSVPPGKKTNNTADDTYYVGQLDIVIRVSRVHTIWLDTQSFNPDFEEPVLEPSNQNQPDGTQVLIEYRGASGFSADALQMNVPFDSTLLDPYGDLTTGAVTFFNGPTWVSDIDDVDGAKFIQARISFINNIDTGLNAELSALGLPFVGS